MLETFLAAYRDALAQKTSGLTDAQAREASCPPSDLNLLGLIRHMADVERGWAQRSFAGLDTPPIFYGPAHPDGDPDGDFHPPASATLADALVIYRREIEAADRIYSAAHLDDLCCDQRTDRPQYSLRWVLVHLIEEYARHCGHADLIRQAVDGATGT